MKFLVRDDDTCAMTQPEELEACYAGLWDDLPICLSVTPFRIPGRSTGVPAALLGRSEPLPLDRNAALVAFLRQQLSRGRLGIAMHGYHHDRPGGQPEFVAGGDLVRKARDGRDYLERVLGGRVTTFVPPHNTLSAAGFDAVVAAGMDVVSNQTRARLRPLLAAADAPLEAAVALSYALAGRLGRSTRHRVRRFPRYRQAPFHTAGPDSDLAELRGALVESHRVRGVFVLATHYHAFERRMRSGETVRDGLLRLVDDARSLGGVRFVDYAGLW